jgi:hypothetical protein
MDTSEFIKRALIVHSNTYEYGRTIYTNARSKVLITCPRHGDFSQRASSHLTGCGCKKCAIEYTAKLKKQSRIEAICPTCTVKFSFPPSESKKNRKYCSKNCSIIARTHLRNTKSCDTCGASFTPKNDSSRFCSISCTALFNTASLKEILNRFRMKFEDRFNYDNVNYVGMHQKVEITCNVHGSFFVTPLQHLQGKNCNNCKQNQRALTKKLKQNTKESSLSDKELELIRNLPYMNNLAACLHCKENFFYRVGRGNAFCSKSCSSKFYGNLKAQESKPTVDSVYESARKIYGDKLTVKQILIKESPKHHKALCSCIHHGDFEITVASLLNDADCHYCSNRKINKSRFLERVVEDSNIRDKGYDYTKVTEIKSSNSVQIFVCRKHGEFEQTVVRHLAGDGCKECAIEKRGLLNFDKAANKWPENAKKVHGDKYGYSDSIYSGAREKTEILCLQHGSFFQPPNNHLNGAGCPDCAEEVRQLGDSIYVLENSGFYIKGKLYVLECLSVDEYFYKIGITTKSVIQRYPTQLSMPYSYTPILEIEIGIIEAYKHEQRILLQFKEHQYIPKLEFGGQTECLSVNPCLDDEKLEFLYNSSFNLSMNPEAEHE